MRKFCIALLLVVVFGTSVGAPVAEAGFGITPPYVRNTSLTRNSVYEQQILMVRSTPSDPLIASIIVDAPQIEEWIEIVEGTQIELPAGEQKVPLTVRVTVPDDAAFDRYTGRIRISTAPPEGAETAGAVNISLGAQVDVDLTVIDREILDFRVRRIDISDIDEGRKLGWLYFPGKIRFGMYIENTGNVDVAPSEVSFAIYDRTGSVLLEETSHTNRIKKVAPFLAEDVVAELPTRLPAGNYLARYAIKNGEEIKQEGELTLNIMPYGTMQTAGYGFFGLSLAHKVSVLLPVFVVVIIIGLIWYRRRENNL
jgi:hypothetical protein